MAQVDPEDDELRRFVVHRYAYDPARRERWHVVVVAFDDRQEFETLIDSLATDVKRRRDAGEDVDPREHISGVVLEPGHRRRQQGGRIIKHAIERGASLGAETWERLANDLPPGMSVVRFVSAPDA